MNVILAIVVTILMLAFLGEAIHHPLYLITNPILAAVIALVLMNRNKEKALVYPLLMSIASLPTFAVWVLYIVHYPIDFFYNIPVPNYSDMHDWFYEAAFGSLGAQLDFISVSNTIGETGGDWAVERSLFALIIMALGSIAIFLFPSLLKNYFLTMLAERQGIELSSNPQLEHSTFFQLFSLTKYLGIGFFYFACFPLLYFSTLLPVGLNYIAFWTLLLIPIWGVPLSTANIFNSEKKTFGFWFLAYFTTVLTLVSADHTYYTFDLLSPVISKVINGDFRELDKLSSLVAIFYILYMALGLVKFRATNTSPVSSRT